MLFTAYDSATGQILYCGDASDPSALESAEVSIHTGERVEPPGWVDSGVFHTLPARPSPAHEFDYILKQWIDPRTVEDVRAAKNAAINASRLRANTSFFTFAGKQIACDPLSRSDIDGAHGMIVATGALPPGWPGAWKAMDNTYVLIPDVATWMQFYGTMVATGVANFNHSQALKAQLAAAQTIAEIEAVPDW